MFQAFAKVTAGQDHTKDLQKHLEELAAKQVYIGVPEGGDNVRGDDITNAELLYIHTHGIRDKEMRDEMNPKVESGEMPYSKAFEMYLHEHGSPLWQSPPRPVLEPSISRNREVIAKQLKNAATAALDGQDPTPELEKAGLLGQNFARAWFTNPDNGWAPNAPGTVERKGSDRPLIDTGELRRSIIYVVTDGDESK